MSLMRCLIIYSPKNNPSSSIQIDDYIKVTIKKNLNSSTNNGDILLKNNFKRWVNPTTGEFMMGEGDTIKVYVKLVDDNSDISTAVGSSDLLIIGEVNSWESQSDEDKSFWKVNFIDKTNLILNQLWGKVYLYSHGKNAPMIIQDAIRQRLNSLKTINVKLDFVNYPNRNGIQITRPNGSAFPIISMTKIWKPLYGWVEELSQVNCLNSESELSSGVLIANKTYVYYVDEFNRLHWFYPDSKMIDWTIDSNVNWYLGSAVSGSPISVKELSSKVGKQTFDVISTVFFRCGKDMNNNGISWYWFDPTVSRGVTSKQTFRPYTKIAEELKLAESMKGNIVFDKTKGFYNYPISYPVTTSWDTIATSNTTYNSQFREEAKVRGRIAASNLTSGRAKPRWKGSISLTYYPFQQGQLINYNNESMGIKNAVMRIMEVTHDITKDFAYTNLEVQEDEIEQGVA